MHLWNGHCHYNRSVQHVRALSVWVRCLQIDYLNTIFKYIKREIFLKNFVTKWTSKTGKCYIREHYSYKRFGGTLKTKLLIQENLSGNFLFGKHCTSFTATSKSKLWGPNHLLNLWLHHCSKFLLSIPGYIRKLTCIQHRQNTFVFYNFPMPEHV
jgi:hypothetical protein